MPMCRIRVSLQDHPALELWAESPTTCDAVLSFLSLGLDIKSLSVSKLPNLVMTEQAQTQPQTKAMPPVVPHVSARHPKYSCADLGVCQGLDLVCTSCKTIAKNPAHAYAPGTITTDPAGLLPGDKSQRRELLRYLVISTAITLGTMLVAGFAGYFWAVAK